MGRVTTRLNKNGQRELGEESEKRIRAREEGGDKGTLGVMKERRILKDQTEFWEQTLKPWEGTDEKEREKGGGSSR